MKLTLVVRVGLFLTLAGLWYLGLWYVAGVVLVGYMFRYTAYEVVILGGFIDMQWMTGNTPWYLLFFVLVFLIIEWLKPQLMAYNQ